MKKFRLVIRQGIIVSLVFSIILISGCGNNSDNDEPSEIEIVSENGELSEVEPASEDDELSNVEFATGDEESKNDNNESDSISDSKNKSSLEEKTSNSKSEESSATKKNTNSEPEKTTGSGKSTDSETAESSASDKTTSSESADFYQLEFSKDSEIFARINGMSYKADCTIPVSDLRYLHLLYVGFDNETHQGEIICNKAIADDLLEIFKELYDNSYQIEKIALIDEYGADDELSMEANNTSCFNYRTMTGSNKVSKHGQGLAIDINPLYNPYVKGEGESMIIEPANAGEYIDRNKTFPGKISHDDLAYKLFTAHGFKWGGDWKSLKDYQHFEK